MKELMNELREAAIKAVEAVDECVGKAVEAVKEVGGVMFICADHGNAEQLIDYETGEPYEPAHYPYQVMFGSYFGVVFTYLMYKYLEPRREKILKVFCKPFVKISNLFKKK